MGVQVAWDSEGEDVLASLGSGHVAIVNTRTVSGLPLFSRPSVRGQVLLRRTFCCMHNLFAIAIP